MSGDLGSLVISLTAETAQFKDALTKAAYQMDQNVGAMVTSANGLTKAIGQIDSQLGAFGINLRNVLGLAAGGAFAGLISSSIESAAHVRNLAIQTGIAADQLAGMKAAAAAGGTTLDDVARASAKFSKAIETQNEDTGSAAKTLGALGLSMEDLKTHSPAEQMHIVAERMNQFADGSGKAAAAQVLFGKSGMEILPFLHAYGEQVNLTKEGYAQYAEQAHQFEVNLGKLKAASQGIVTQYAQALLPSLNAVVEGFIAMNSASKGSIGFMDLVGDAIRVLALGIVVIWTTVKNVAIDVAGYLHTSYLISQGDILGAKKAWDDSRASIDKNTASMLAFSDKALAGSKIFGDASTAVEGVGNAAEQAKPKLDLAQQAMKDAADAAKKLQQESDELQKTLDKLGGKDTAYEDALGRLAKAANTGAISQAQYAYYAKLAYDQSKIGTQAHNDAAAAAAKQKAELDKLVTTEQQFHDQLQKQIDLIGATKEEILKYDAAEKGLGDSQDDLIETNVRLLQQEADKATAFKTAQDFLAAYVDYQNQVAERNQNIINSWLDGNRALSAQTDELGMTKTAVELLRAAKQYESDQAIINSQADIHAIEDQTRALTDAYNQRIALINGAAMKQAYLDSAAAETKAFEDSAKSINKSLVDALYDALFTKGKSIGESIKSALESMFKSLVLRPILQPISNALAGIYQQGAGALSGFFGAGSSIVGSGSLASQSFGPGTGDGSGVLAPVALGSVAARGSWAGALGGAVIGGAITSQYGSKSPIPGVIAGGVIGYAAVAGIAAAGTALAAGATAATAATTAFAAAAAAVPVIGWIVAAIAIIASFAIKPGGGPKTGGSSISSYDTSGSLSQSRGDFYTPNDRDSDLAKFTQGIGTTYLSTIAALGGKAAAVSFGMGYDMDPQGTAQNRLSESTTVNGKQVYGFQNLELGRDSGLLQARMTVEAQRMLLAAVQASQLPDDIAALLDNLTPAALGADQIANVLAYAGAFHSLPDAIKVGLVGITGLNITPETSVNLTKFGAAYSAVLQIIAGDPGKDAQTLLDAANQTALEKFHSQADALRTMSTAFDGSADAALNLAQATATYYQNMVQLLVALDQATATFHKSIQDLERSINLDVLDPAGKQSFYQAEINRMQANLAQAALNPSTADPANVAKWAQQAEDDYKDWWGTLDATQKAQQQANVLANLDALDKQLADANKAIADGVKAQNDPNNPNSPIAGVKSAFDKFMLDMGKWLEDNKGVAQTQVNAAELNAQAAQQQLDAAVIQQAAANTPIQVTVNNGGNEVTAGQ